MTARRRAWDEKHKGGREKSQIAVHEAAAGTSSGKCTMSLRAALYPNSVAVFGASDNPNKIGGRPLRFMADFGFEGAVYPINPNRDVVQGFKTYPSLDSLPEAPELALIAVPGQAAVDAVEAAARVGTKVCVVLSSGFGEIAHGAGAKRQSDMVAIARGAGMRLVGPNSQGLANFHNGAVVGFSTMFIEFPPADGPVGIVSQSGGMAGLIYGVLRQKNIGVRYAHATGNDADVSTLSLAVEVARDPAIRLLLLYTESITDMSELEELGRLARRRQLPVVMLKAGRTTLGGKAAQSHTGALANEDRVIEACLEECGIWRARDVSQLVGSAELYLKGWTPRGRRVAVISNSGASCVAAADAISDCDLQLAELHLETKSALGRVLPEFASVANPIDLTAALLSNGRLFGDILPILGQDPAADAFVIAIPVAGEGYDVDAFARDAADFAEQTGKPVVIAASLPKVTEAFAAADLPSFPYEMDAVSALARFCQHHELMARPESPARSPPPIPAQGPPQTVALNEAESLALLTASGLPVVPYRLCHSPNDAHTAFVELGGPVVVKGCSRDAPHKSELALVRLGVTSAEEASAACADMIARLQAAGCCVDGVLVAKMISGRRELMAGARNDPHAGPVILLGDGGKYVEAISDVQLLLAPVNDASVGRAVDRLRVGAILRGVRGESSIDFAALTSLLLGLGRLVSDPSSGIQSLDINPVMVDERGTVIVDALAVTIQDRREP